MTWLLESKLALPATPPSWLGRSALCAAAKAPAVLFSGGPGSGKTLSMLALLQQRGRPGAEQLWYALDEDDADPIAFSQHLLAAMRARIPDFARELDDLLAGDAPDPRRFWGTFFASAAAYNLPHFTLAMDDLHHLADAQPEWVRALGLVLERMTPAPSVLMTSRKALPLPAGKLVAAERLDVLDAERLRFTPEEEAQYMRLRAGDRPIPQAWLDRAKPLDGWPLGLRLVTAEGLLPLYSAAPAEGLEDYLREELVFGQPWERRCFMLRAALLEDPTLAMLQAIAPDPQAEAHLAALVAHQLVVVLADGVTFRFPLYLRDFLRQEVGRTLPAEEVAALHVRAAAYQRNRGRDDLAIPHLLANEDYVAAMEACWRCFPALATAGRTELMERWLSAFPMAMILEEGRLLLWRAHLFYRKGNLERALDTYELARKRFSEAEEPANELKALVRQCAILAQGEESQRLRPLLLQAQALQGAGNDADRAELLAVRATLAEARGDLALVRECYEAIAAMRGGGAELATLRSRACLQLALLDLAQGDLDASQRHASAAQALANQEGLVGKALFARFLIAELGIVRGEPETAAAFIRTLPPGWEETLDWQDRGVALAVIGHAQQAHGNWPAAEEALAASVAVFERAGSKAGAKRPLEHQAWLAIARGQPARALRLVESVGFAGENLPDMALAVAHARAQHLAGEPAKASTAWSRLIPLLEEHSAHFLAVKAKLYATATLAACGEQARAAVSLAAVTVDMEARGYGFLRKLDAPLWAELAGLVAEPAPAVAKIKTPAPPPVAKPAGGALLDIRCFGSFELRLDGRLLEDWPRRKAKRVLAALALQPAGMEALELAMAIGESDDETGLNALRTSVMALRRVLEPSLGKGEVSAFVRSTATGYALALETVANNDVQAFTRAVEHADAVLKNEGPAPAFAAYDAALAIYRGNLLDEPFFDVVFEPQRQRLQGLALRCLRTLHDMHLARGDRTSAEQAVTRAIALAPTEEEPYLQLMRLHAAAGRQERVRQTYWDFRKALKAKLDVAPGPEFEAAYKAIAQA